MAVSAEAVPVSGVQGYVQGLLAQMSSQQKTGLMLAVSAIVALLAGGWMWTQAPEYKVLFSNISDRDGGAIIASLQQLNVPYKFADGGGAILVPFMYETSGKEQGEANNLTSFEGFQEDVWLGMFAAVGNAIPILHGEDPVGQFAGAALFFALAVVLTRFARRKLE